jgi:serine/threonine protein kinase
MIKRMKKNENSINASYKTFFFYHLYAIMKTKDLIKNIKSKNTERDIIFKDTKCAYLGGGIDGNVYKYNKYALKRYDDDAVKDYLLEVKFLEILKHKNIIKMYEKMSDDDYHYLVLELCDESIADIIYEKNGIPKVKVAKRIMRETLQGLKYIHECGIIHRDIKIENLIRGLNGDTKIIDFSSAIYEQDCDMRRLGTLVLNSPEMNICAPLTRANDVWSFVLTAFEMITGKLIFDVNNEFEFDYCDELSYCEDDYESSSYDSSKKSLSDMSNSTSSDSDIGFVKKSESYSSSDEYDQLGHTMLGADDNTYRNVYRLLLLQEKILGPPPTTFTEWAPLFYNSDGRLKNTKQMTYLSLDTFLKINFGAEFKNHITAPFIDFVQRGLYFEPEKRASVVELLAHPYLK